MVARPKSVACRVPPGEVVSCRKSPFIVLTVRARAKETQHALVILPLEHMNVVHALAGAENHEQVRADQRKLGEHRVVKDLIQPLEFILEIRITQHVQPRLTKRRS